MVPKYLQRFRVIVARLVAWLMFQGPVEIHAGTRHRFIFDPRLGRLLPIIAGASGEEDEDADKDKSGDSDDDQDDDEDADKDKSGDSDDDQDDDEDADKDKSGGKKPDWKVTSRKHERRAKAAKRERDAAVKERDELKAKVAKLETKKDADKPDPAEAIEAAKKEARDAALAEGRQDRRDDRLEAAVTRLSVKGVEIDDGDGKTKTVKFADPEDVQAHLDRQIARGDLDADEIFDDKDRVDADSLTDLLVEIAESKPHWLTGADTGGAGGGGKKAGDADGGKGRRKKGGDEMSVEDHLKKVRRTKT